MPTSRRYRVSDRVRVMRFIIAFLAYAFDVAAIPALAAGAQSTERPMAEARQTFENRCAGCHGLDGRGGERAPDIATSAKVQQRTDGALTQVITNGIPTGGMPSFSSLDAPTIRSLVKYLRFLQGASQSAKLPGSPEAGKVMFFGKARCSQCHLAAGEGGFIGPDLTSYGRHRPPEEIGDAITKPSKQPGIGRSVVTVTTQNGQNAQRRHSQRRQFFDSAAIVRWRVPFADEGRNFAPCTRRKLYDACRLRHHTRLQSIERSHQFSDHGRSTRKAPRSQGRLRTHGRGGITRPEECLSFESCALF